MTPTIADRHVLAVEVRLGAGLDRGGDFAHPVVAGGLLQNPADRYETVDDRSGRADERENEAVGVGHGVLSRCVARNRGSASAPASVRPSCRDVRESTPARPCLPASRRGPDAGRGRKTRYCASLRATKSSRSAFQIDEIRCELLRHGDVLQAHVLRQAVLERRRRLAADQRREVAARACSVMPKPSAVMKSGGSIFSTLATFASGASVIFHR